MSGKDLLKKIPALWQAGKWVDHLITPDFRRALQLSTGMNNQENLTALTAYRYLKLNSAWDGADSKQTFLGQHIIDTNVTNSSFWKSAVSSLKRPASLASPDTKWEQILESSLQLIRTNQPETAEVLKSMCRYFCIVDKADFKSASNPHFFGTIFLSKNIIVEELAISIIHELAHHELFLVNLIDRLVEKGSDLNLVYAPYQKKDRTPAGRLHSAHALFRMLHASKIILPTKSEEFKILLRDTVKSFVEGELTSWARSWVYEVYN